MRQRGDMRYYLALGAALCPPHLLYSQNAPPRPVGRILTTYTRRASVAAHAPSVTLSLSNKTQPFLTNNVPSPLHTLLSFLFSSLRPRACVHLIEALLTKAAHRSSFLHRRRPSSVLVVTTLLIISPTTLF